MRGRRRHPLRARTGTPGARFVNGGSSAEPVVSVVVYRDSNRPPASSGDVANLRSTRVPAQIGRSFITWAASALTP